MIMFDELGKQSKKTLNVMFEIQLHTEQKKWKRKWKKTSEGNKE